MLHISSVAMVILVCRLGKRSKQTHEDRTMKTQKTLTAPEVMKALIVSFDGDRDTMLSWYNDQTALAAIKIAQGKDFTVVFNVDLFRPVFAQGNPYPVLERDATAWIQEADLYC